jgi:hypothetical protein
VKKHLWIDSKIKKVYNLHIIFRKMVDCMDYNLSKPQEAIYYMSRFAEDGIANIAGDVFFNFTVSVEATRKAILNFLDKCDVMHTRIIHVDGKPLQRIVRDYDYINIPVLSFENYDKLMELYKILTK